MPSRGRYVFVCLTIMAITATIARGVDPPLNNIDTAPCAAGDHCTHPASAGIVQLTGQNHTPQECFESHPLCFVLRLYCRCIEGSSQRSRIYSEGRQVFSTTSNEEGTTLCHTCLKRLEPDCRALSASLDGSLDAIRIRSCIRHGLMGSILYSAR